MPSAYQSGCHLQSKRKRKMEASILQDQFTCSFVDCSILYAITTAVRPTFFDKKDVHFQGFHGIIGICVSVATQRKSRS